MGKRIMALPVAMPGHATAHIAEYMDTANPVCGLKQTLLQLGCQPQSPHVSSYHRAGHKVKEQGL